MSMGSNREEMGIIAASLRQHVQRGEKAGIRFLSRAESGGHKLEDVADLAPGEGIEGNLCSAYA